MRKKFSQSSITVGWFGSVRFSTRWLPLRLICNLHSPSPTQHSCSNARVNKLLGAPVVPSKKVSLWCFQQQGNMLSPVPSPGTEHCQENTWRQSIGWREGGDGDPAPPHPRMWETSGKQCRPNLGNRAVMASAHSDARWRGLLKMESRTIRARFSVVRKIFCLFPTHYEAALLPGSDFAVFRGTVGVFLLNYMLTF